MDLMRARVMLRERSLLDVFDLALRFCMVHAKDYAKMSLAVLAPGMLLSLGAVRLGGYALAWPVSIAASTLATAPFVALASRLVFADAVRTPEALGLSLRALPILFVVRLMQLLILCASLLMALLPWIWLGSILLFVVEVVVLEQASIGGAFVRAQRIASSHMGSATVAMLLLLLGPIAAALITDAAGREVLQTVLEIKPPPSVLKAGGSWLALVGFWGALPLLTTARFFAYLDVRTRTEGWDIQTRFASIAARDDAAANAPGRRAA